MKDQSKIIKEHSVYSIETIDKLAVVKFNADSPIEELYDPSNSNEFFETINSPELNKGITTNLFIFTNGMFSEDRFDKYFKTIKIDKNEKVDFLSLASNIRMNALARITAIKHRFIKNSLESGKLNIYAMQGSSIGLWLSTVLSGDYSILSEGSEFSFPFLEDDILPMGGLIYYLDKYAGKAALDNLLLIGDPITTADLKKWGLVSRILPNNSFEQAAIDIALRISSKSPYYIKRIKQYKQSLNKHLEISIDLEHEFYVSRGIRKL